MPESELYEVLEKIGHGSFGVIRKVRRKKDGMVLCRKEISYLKMSQKEREQLHAEFQILSTLRHPNIVGYYHREHLKASQDLHLYMEYCGNGDLGRVIRDLTQKNQYAEESFVWSVFSQLVTALYRCHYGVDPPEVGKGVLGLGVTAKPKTPAGAMTILHRDLKPENVFLSEDNSVKLGDFGLSKVIQSHDFASTYVGTPFYMSPEICAAERYTLKSDVWSLGCIIYELCTREPPFNAKTHFQLIQKIKEGKTAPLPSVYSAELGKVVGDCLRVSADRRPDTATLLNLPAVRLMRKEKEVVEFNRTLRTKEEALNKRLRELEQKMTTMDADKVYIRQEIDASLRREWEVKARLEIDRLVRHEVEALRKKFEHEVRARVEAELQQLHKKAVSFTAAADDAAAAAAEPPQDLSSSSATKSDCPPQSSIGALSSADGDFPSTTDLTELSMDSPDVSEPSKRHARTPFARAQTMFAGTPMDVEMGSPSPMAIASLALSPRRGAATRAPATNPSNIFTAPAARTSGDASWDAAREPPAGVFDSDSDSELHIPSPTRMIRSNKNPFASREQQQQQQQQHPPRPALHAQKSAPLQRLVSKQKFNLPQITTHNHSDTSLAAPPPLLPPPASQLQPPSSGKLAAKNSNIKGRTLVELQQARAGGRPISGVFGGGDSSAATLPGANPSPKRAFREHAAAVNRGIAASEPVAVWDPEKDEMPSPFLVRRKPVPRG